MSPNRRNYQDGVDDGNSNWYDRNRFQRDADYYDGVRDGWREKEKREDQAREDANQKMLDRMHNRIPSSLDYSTPSSHSTTPGTKEPSCIMIFVWVVVGIIIWGGLSIFLIQLLGNNLIGLLPATVLTLILISKIAPIFR